MSGFACNIFDLHLAVVNFGHFVLEQTAQHVLVSAAQNDLRAATVASYLGNIRANFIVGAITLSGDLVLARHNRFRTPQADRQRPVTDALHRAGDEIAFTLNKFLVQCFTFGLADALQDNLLGCLRGDAAKTDARLNRHHDRVANLRIRHMLSRLVERDLGLIGLNRIDDLFFQVNVRLSGRIDPSLDTLVVADVGIALIGGNQRLRQGVHHYLTRQRAQFDYFVKRQGEIAFHGSA